MSNKLRSQRRARGIDRGLSEGHAFGSILSISLMAVTLLMLAGPPEASAAQATWSSESVLTAPITTGSIYVRAASNVNGVAALVWDQRVDNSTSHVYAAVNDGSGWSTPRRLTVSPTAYNATSGAVVAPDGTVTVFWVEGTTPYFSAYATGGWTPAAVIPADPDYGNVAGAGVDNDGNVQVLMAALRSTGSSKTYDMEVLVKDSLGNWTAPTPLTTTPGSYPRLLMNSSGQALAVAGYLAWRSGRTGQWDLQPKAIPSMAGQTYTIDAALDAVGNGYFVLRNRYGGMNISTSTPTSNWTALRHLTKFDGLGSSIAITGGGVGGALIYGVDYLTGKLRASVTTSAGKSWGTLTTFGVIDTQATATGGETGLYGIAWDGKVSVGTGVGTKAVAWNTQVVAPNPYFGDVAVAGNRAVSGWARGTDPTLVDMVIGARTATISP